MGQETELEEAEQCTAAAICSAAATLMSSVPRTSDQHAFETLIRLRSIEYPTNYPCSLSHSLSKCMQ